MDLLLRRYIIPFKTFFKKSELRTHSYLSTNNNTSVSKAQVDNEFKVQNVLSAKLGQRDIDH